MAGPRHFAKSAAPLAVVILALEILHLLGIPVAFPGLPLLAAIVWTGFSAGMRPGLVATTVCILYELLTFSSPSHWFSYSSENALRVLLFAASAVSAAIMVGILRNRVEAATYELAHHRALETWHAESASLQSVLHRLPLGVLVADAASGEITFANEKARTTLGGDVQRLHSLGFPTMNHIDSGLSYSPGEWPLRRCIEEGMPAEEEFLYTRENGQIVVIHSYACPIFDERGKPVAAVMSLTDVAEKKNKERQLTAVVAQAANAENSATRHPKRYRFA